jgi:hypothetical protein
LDRVPLGREVRMMKTEFASGEFIEHGGRLVER